MRKRIEELRTELERAGSDVEQTRGRIAELRDLDRLIDPADAIEGSSGAYFPTRNSAP